VDRHVVTIPTQAVQRGPLGAFVFVVNDKGAASRRVVTIGQQSEAQAVVIQGVQAGDEVVTDGASRVTDGAKVRVVAS
jgi:multidrug efflux system membrane fusion protein